MFDRRQFLATAAAAATASQNEWGGPVMDLHHHLRQTEEADFAHLNGAGITHAILLTRAGNVEQARSRMAKHPGRFQHFVSADITKAESFDILRGAAKAGAKGFGEIKFHVALDGPELRRLYSLAAELSVPVLVHFQEVPHFEGEGTFSTGFPKLGPMIKAHPKTMFLGHADAVWANVSGEVPKDIAYPTHPIKPGGLTDRWLGEFENFYADMSAFSGNNAVNRGDDFMRGFLERHRTKLIWGSDCACRDGHGLGIKQPFWPERIYGKCIARETLSKVRSLCSAQTFRRIVWENGSRLFGFRA